MKKRFSDEQIINILREAEAGVSARELCRKHAISDATFYIYGLPLVLHADNGAAMMSQTLQVKLAELKIPPSHSRLRVSNDNVYVESLFRTLKYVPQWPSPDFKTLNAERNWVEKFIR